MSDAKRFYVTTPIYYGNGVPHVGHFYTSTIANVLYLYYKIHGADARFTTGIDENSQKSVIEAEKAGISITEYLDTMAAKHQEVWDYFDFWYTDFIRTTEERHHSVVRDVLQHCFDKGDIYEWVYEGKYCVGCEAFKKDDDLIPDPSEKWDSSVLVCPDHLKEPDQIKEKNYFFRLSKYQNWIEWFYAAHPDFVMPDFRFNEVRAFVERWLEDFSISRETNTFGIPLPFDESQVTYVWFDALFNYYTSCKYSPHPLTSSLPEKKGLDGFTDESSFWPAQVHVVGKDIIRFHAIFWPAMLASYFDLGEEHDGQICYKASDTMKLPKHILTGWFFTVDGQKMSKSLWNVIEPVEYSQEYSKDLLILYMLSAFPIGNDGNYDREEAIKTYNAKLANNLGNLVNRVVVLSLKLDTISSGLSGVVHDRVSSLLAYIDHSLNYSLTQEQVSQLSQSLIDAWENIDVPTVGKMKSYDLKWVLDEVFIMLDHLNKYADTTEPWKTIKEDEESTREVLYTLAEWLRQVWLHLYPFFPEKMSEMFEKLGLDGYTEKINQWGFQELLDKKEIFNIKEKGKPLFQRIEI